MGTAKRVIARMDIKGPNLVKGIHLEGLRVLGKPETFAKYYYEQGVDELLYMDVVASLYERNSLDEIIRKTASEVFIPLTVGGGLRTVDDIRKVLLAGADKVSLNTAAIKNPDIIKEASRYFGSSTIVISIEAIRQPDGKYLAYIDNGREYTGVEVTEWAKRVEDLGAGEIILTSVDREGTGKGYDLNLTRAVAESVSIPVVACGGAGKIADITDVLMNGKADAVSIASILHYDYIKKHPIAGDYSGEGNIEFRKKNSSYMNFELASIQDVKQKLAEYGIEVRYCKDKQA
jgi:cyclase